MRAAVVLGVCAAVWAGSARAAYPLAVEGAGGMVVSSQRLASEAGAEMLRRGGNAVDAAVATAYAEAVVNPCCGNIGGGGFLVVHLADGRDRFLDFREVAPAGASAGMFLDAKGAAVPGASLEGWRAVGVPGTVLGLDTAEREWGVLGRAAVMAPAMRLAREGFVLERGDTDILDAKVDLLRRDAAAKAVFLRPDGGAWRPGDRLVQADLGALLGRIAAEGPGAFYAGAVPAAVGAASRAGGGVLGAADFGAYRVVEDAPVACPYRGVVVVSAAPPSSGGVALCEALGVLGGYDLAGMGWGSAAALHLEAEALRHAFVDRNALLGDPAFVRNPVGELLSPAYLAGVRGMIGAGAGVGVRPGVGVHPGAAVMVEAGPAGGSGAGGVAPGGVAGGAGAAAGSAGAGGTGEKAETTSISVLDRAGNAASLTYTVNGLFGAGVMAPGTGFLLNDEMDDFTTRAGAANLFGLVQGAANAIVPGKRPLSSMAPSVVLRDGRAVMVVGSPGGSRIISIVLEVVLGMVDFGMGPQEAVDAPRVHMQGEPDVLYAEPGAVLPDARRVLQGQGYRVVEQVPWGAAELVAVGGGFARARAGAGSSGSDAARSGGGMRAGVVYGAHDDRRPAGAAVGE